jgi:uncharacterized phage-associated protein
MPFRLDTQKAIEATAVLLRASNHKMMGRKRLLALLYIADRISLQRTGRPIIGGKLRAMKYGPIHGEVYSFVQGEHYDQEKWSRSFCNEGYLIKMSHDPGVSALSRYEIKILNQISEQYMAAGDWDVANDTHEFPEYKNIYPQGTNASLPISLESVIREVGGDVDKILKDANDKSVVDQIFSSTP